MAGARRAFGQRRIGHTGTLDPFATGLLLLLLGRWTRLAEYFHALGKSYEATLRLGIETDTDDPTGREIRRSTAWRDLSNDAIEEAFEAWLGERRQVPSAFSAKRVDGERAYRAARRGEDLALAAAPITVHAIEVLAVDLPHVDFRTTVSTGTYVRALARDVGRGLGCGAHLARLRRTAIGPFPVDAAADPEALATLAADDPAWRHGEDAVRWMSRRKVDAGEREALRHGRTIPRGRIEPPDPSCGHHPAEPGPVALLAGGDLLAVGREDGDLVRPTKVFDA